MTAPVNSAIRFPECINCARRQCEKADPETLDICDFGIAFYRRSEEIVKKREGVTLRHVAQNLRHELHKVLQLIVSEAVEIDDQISVRSMDLEKPASRIVGATVILDNFIEMIAGVYNFNPYEETQEIASSAINLYYVASRYRDTYSLIQNTRRSKALHFRIDEYLKKIFISRQKHVIEYLIAILTDNAWKYSADGSPVVISAKHEEKNIIHLSITNSAPFISQKDKLFDRGYRVDSNSEGFGFGLYWAKILADHYNKSLNRDDDFLDITHEEKKSHVESLRYQVFTITNILID